MSVARILVVDDVDDNRFTLVRRLKRLGHTLIDTAEDGREAMAMIAETPYDLMLLDIMMPEMDGYQVLEALNDSGQINDLPVIMISALTELDSVVRCIELGAEDYLPKPFNATLLRARIGAVLEKKRLRDAVRLSHDRMARELDAARTLQLGMVPGQFPPVASDQPWDIAGRMIPAREVGGDFFDVFEIASGRMCVVLGDVSDKGTPAALFMARARGAIRMAVDLLTDAAGTPPTPSAVLAQANAELCRYNAGRMFVTVVIGFLDPASGVFDWANAGHPAPLRVGPSGVQALAGQVGPPLGIRARLSWHDNADPAPAQGEVLLVISDGVSDAADASGAFWGQAGLIGALNGQAGRSAGAVVDHVLDALSAHRGDAEPFDDITLLAVTRP